MARQMFALQAERAELDFPRIPTNHRSAFVLLVVEENLDTACRALNAPSTHRRGEELLPVIPEKNGP